MVSTAVAVLPWVVVPNLSSSLVQTRRRSSWLRRPRPVTFANGQLHYSPTAVYEEIMEVPLEANDVTTKTTRSLELKEEVAKMLDMTSGQKDALTLIDTIERLGIGHHFDKQIGIHLDQLVNSRDDEQDLHFIALRFRLLRQYGYNVPQDTFYKFMGRDGKFRNSLCRDPRGLLSLYEASYIGTRDEEILTQAMEFSREHLKSSMVSMEPNLIKEVSYALDHPRHLRMERSEARRNIEEYKKINRRSSILMEFATSEFNIFHSQYQKEITKLLRWWTELGLVEKLSFARDQPLECFLWSVGMFPEPCFSQCRVEVAKAVAILVVIDDIYDIYGTLDELILFIDAIRRWELDAMEQLPEYMKICYMALYNYTNEVGYKVLKEHGLCITPHLRKTWVDFCQAHLVEARWFNKGFVPPLEDYLRNGVGSVGAYTALLISFFLMGKQVTKESLDHVDTFPNLFFLTGRIVRLWNDLGTAKDEQIRGDVASSIECYKKQEECSSDEDARRHIRQLISSSWKDLNKELLTTSPLPPSMGRACLNLARTAQSIYQHGDDSRAPCVNDFVQSLFIKKIDQ